MTANLSSDREYWPEVRPTLHDWLKASDVLVGQSITRGSVFASFQGKSRIDATATEGMSEPGLPPLAPVFANAIAQLTGKPLRALPFKLA